MDGKLGCKVGAKVTAGVVRLLLRDGRRRCEATAAGERTRELQGLDAGRNPGCSGYLE